MKLSPFSSVREEMELEQRRGRIQQGVQARHHARRGHVPQTGQARTADEHPHGEQHPRGDKHYKEGSDR